MRNSKTKGHPDRVRWARPEPKKTETGSVVQRPKEDEVKGDLADRAYEDSEAELLNQIERIRRKVGRP